MGLLSAIIEPSTMAAKTWLSLRIYTSTQVLSGSAYFPHYQRLLDLLNGAPGAPPNSPVEFLPLSDVSILYQDGREQQVSTALVNKGSILMA